MPVPSEIFASRIEPRRERIDALAHLEHLGHDRDVLVERKAGERGELAAEGVPARVVAEEVADRAVAERPLDGLRRAAAERTREAGVEGEPTGARGIRSFGRHASIVGSSAVSAASSACTYGSSGRARASSRCSVERLVGATERAQAPGDRPAGDVLLLGRAVQVGGLDGLLEVARAPPRHGRRRAWSSRGCCAGRRPTAARGGRGSPSSTSKPSAAHSSSCPSSFRASMCSASRTRNVEPASAASRTARVSTGTDSATPVGRGQDAAALDVDACAHLGDVALGVVGRDAPGDDAVEHVDRLGEPALDAERTRQLRRHHRAHVRGMLIVVGGLAEPLLARRGIAEIPQPVDHLLFVPPVVGRFGGHLVGRVIHPSIMAAPPGPPRGHDTARPRRYAAGA